jgi:hypothetical protein
VFKTLVSFHQDTAWGIAPVGLANTLRSRETKVDVGSRVEWAVGDTSHECLGREYEADETESTRRVKEKLEGLQD